MWNCLLCLLHMVSVILIVLRAVLPTAAPHWIEGSPHSLRGENSMPNVATTTDGGEECRRGRRLDTSKARNSLGWTPAFESFEAYCQHMAACGEQEQS
mmetsp:Transcript_48656/g.97476  ORF Transcript_48656/g.97476 Transcript_48656/m.97476 type:complete len:98 (-) Transcript_48656:126-419(-)